MPPPSIWQQLSAWVWPPATPTTPEGADRGPRARALRRYKTASARDQLNIGELFDLYEEVSAVFLRGQLDKEIFVDQVAANLCTTGVTPIGSSTTFASCQTALSIQTRATTRCCLTNVRGFGPIQSRGPSPSRGQTPKGSQ